MIIVSTESPNKTQKPNVSV